MKVQIKNYQAIKKAELEFVPGVNVIVGSTNNGKSSIIRAIQGAINNQGGSGFINYDADQTEVTIANKEDKLIWTKSRKQGKSSYNINGVELTKIGQKQLPEVASLLNMHEVEVGLERFQINFWKQMEKPFLVDKTAYQLFDFISQSKEQEFVAGLQNKASEEYKQLNSDIKDINVRNDTLTSQITVLHSDIDRLSKIEEIDIEKLEKALDVLEKLETDIAKYEAYKKRITKLKPKLTLVETNTTKLDKLFQDVEETAQMAEQLENLLGKYYSACNKSIEVDKSIKNLDANLNLSIKQMKIIEEYIKDINKLKDTESVLKDKVTKYESYRRQYNNYSNELNSTNKLIKEIELELEEFEVCPLCGHALDKNHNHMGV